MDWEQEWEKRVTQRQGGGQKAGLRPVMTDLVGCHR
jgi:hypothetical protein